MNKKNTKCFDTSSLLATYDHRYNTNRVKGTGQKDLNFI